MLVSVRVRKILVIGIGVGNPDHLTVQAIDALRSLDVVFVMNKAETRGLASDELLGVRKLICERYLGDKPYRLVELSDPARDPQVADYTARVEHWHERRAGLFEDALQHELSEGQHGGVLVWGDPALYDSTLRLLERVLARGRFAFEYRVIPGITSIAALAASHRIALHRIGGAVLITTGRKLREQGFPAGVDDVVVMLDGECSFQQLDPAGLEIYWGAYLGTPDEILSAGPLSEQTAVIAQLRSQARARHGWIMDIYLLRKAAP
ncbi:MAG: hypothetical protein RL701_1353 [Pseudomonadota bacterium]|jgi:precorrin-6A synthase